MLSLQIEFLREYQLDTRHWVFLLTLFILTFTHTNKHRAHVLKHMQPFIHFLWDFNVTFETHIYIYAYYK